MAGAVRIIERLRLRASSEAAVRRAVLALEDAFRTATLPDAGARLIVVRCLDLGRLPRGASAQRISLLLESRVTAAHRHVVHGGDEGANGANAVWFRDALEAHLLAACHVAAGQSASAWFWPRVVPALAEATSPLDALRSIALSVAALEEAPAALPAWTIFLVRAGYRRQLLAALRPGDGVALQRAAGGTATAHRAGRGDARSGTAAHEHPDSSRRDDRREFIEEMIGRSRGRPWLPADLPQSHAESTDSHPDDTEHPARMATPDDPFPPQNIPSPAVATRAAVARIGADPVSAGDPLVSNRPAPDGTRSPIARTNWGGGGTRHDVAARVQTQRCATADDVLATSAGGLFFLVPVMERLGIAEWCAQVNADPVDAAGQILRLALSRLHIEDDDPAWHLATGADVTTNIDVEVLRTSLGLRLARLAPGRGKGAGSTGPPEPSVWSDAGARRRFERIVSMPDLWLASARRVLRRQAAIGLATLIRRPARLTITATHVDLFFAHDAGDVRVRRAGLDIDPGWVPWLSKVVMFHYRDRWWS